MKNDARKPARQIVLAGQLTINDATAIPFQSGHLFRSKTGDLPSERMYIRAEHPLGKYTRQIAFMYSLFVFLNISTPFRQVTNKGNTLQTIKLQ